MRVVLLEDEPPAMAQLEAAVRAHGPDVEIVGRAETVRDAVPLLAAQSPDLVIADIHLADGSALRLFEKRDFGSSPHRKSLGSRAKRRSPSSSKKTGSATSSTRRWPSSKRRSMKRVSFGSIVSSWSKPTRFAASPRPERGASRSRSSRRRATRSS